MKVALNRDEVVRVQDALLTEYMNPGFQKKLWATCVLVGDDPQAQAIAVADLCRPIEGPIVESLGYQSIAQINKTLPEDLKADPWFVWRRKTIVVLLNPNLQFDMDSNINVEDFEVDICKEGIAEHPHIQCNAPDTSGLKGSEDPDAGDGFTEPETLPANNFPPELDNVDLSSLIAQATSDVNEALVTWHLTGDNVPNTRDEFTEPETLHTDPSSLCVEDPNVRDGFTEPEKITATEPAMTNGDTDPAKDGLTEPKELPTTGPAFATDDDDSSSFNGDAPEQSLHNCQMWTVVSEKGLLVRRQKSLTSEMEGARLSFEAEVYAIEQVGERLHYRKFNGEGPEEGWVTISAAGRTLMLPT